MLNRLFTSCASPAWPLISSFELSRALQPEHTEAAGAEGDSPATTQGGDASSAWKAFQQQVDAKRLVVSTAGATCSVVAVQLNSLLFAIIGVGGGQSVLEDVMASLSANRASAEAAATASAEVPAGLDDAVQCTRRALEAALLTWCGIMHARPELLRDSIQSQELIFLKIAPGMDLEVRGVARSAFIQLLCAGTEADTAVAFLRMLWSKLRGLLEARPSRLVPWSNWLWSLAAALVSELHSSSNEEVEELLPAMFRSLVSEVGDRLPLMPPLCRCSLCPPLPAPSPPPRLFRCRCR